MSSYWKKRSEQVALRQHAKTDRYAASLGREYGRAMQSVQRDIESFYGRYAVNNEISLAEARKLLTKPELNDFKMTLEEFIEKAKDNADGRWTKQLNNTYYRTRISRFEALQVQIRQQVEILAASRQAGLGSLLGDVYEDTYYRMMFEIQRGTGIGASFARLDDIGMHKVLGTEFANSNWSKRIWGDRDKLAAELHTKLTQSFIRGDSIERTIRDVRDRFNVSHSNARRLVQTESAFFSEQATMDSYKESGVVDQYEILATLDGITSDICREMDGKVFRLSEQEVGVTYPPFHVNCRTTTVPYFDDEDDVGERIARDADGQTYSVDGDMSYEQWYQEHVVGKYGQEQADIMKKKIVNKSSDREQYGRYKEVLGKDAPKSFAEFQDLKYNDSEGWSEAKGDYRKLNAYEKIISKEPQITADLLDVSKTTGAELVGLDYRLKSKDSYLRKVGFDSNHSLDYNVINETISKTNDVIRYTYQAVHNDLADKYFAINKELTNKGYQLTKVKNTWTVKNNPYKGINNKYVSPNGQSFEIQFHTPESFKLKNGEMHKLYEQWRLLENKGSNEAVELSKKMANLSSKLKIPDKIDKVR